MFTILLLEYRKENKYMADWEVQENYSADDKLNFEFSNIQKFIINRGAHVSWERSYLCTCRSETGLPKSDCPICHGLGFAFLPPKETSIALQSMARGTKNGEVGLSFSGTALATTTAEDSPYIGFRDRLSFNDRPIPESMLVKVTQRDVTHGIDMRYDVIDIKNVIYGYDPVITLNSEEINNLIDYDKNLFRPTQDMVGKYLSINMTVALRFYVVDFIREGRYQYEGDPRKINSSSGFETLPSLLMVRREDMYVPSVINDNEKATPVALDPKVSLIDDPDIGNMFGDR